MHSTPLSARVILLSWATAAGIWPLLWWLLAAAQGLGTTAAGGSFIGLAVPLARQPWALVNQPTGAFSATMAALPAYWLAPALFALALAVAGPLIGPAPPSWWGELIVFHLAMAAAALGLGFAPALGIDDGPARGLLTFWQVPPALFMAVAACLGALGATFAVVRLSGFLWAAPGGPTRRRRLLVALVHGMMPGVAWLVVAWLAGWGLPVVASVLLVLVVLAPLAFAWTRIPHSALARPSRPGAVKLGLTLIAGGAVLVLAAAAGGPESGRVRGFVWREPGMTNNVRSAIVVHRVWLPRPVTRPRPSQGQYAPRPVRTAATVRAST